MRAIGPHGRAGCQSGCNSGPSPRAAGAPRIGAGNGRPAAGHSVSGPPGRAESTLVFVRARVTYLAIPAEEQSRTALPFLPEPGAGCQTLHARAYGTTEPLLAPGKGRAAGAGYD